MALKVPELAFTSKLILGPIMQQDPNISLGQRISAARHAAGLTLQELADQCGCAKSYLSALENSQRTTPSEELLTKIEGALGLPSNSLVGPAQWERSLAAGGPAIRRQVAKLHEERETARRLVELLKSSSQGKNNLDAAYSSGELKRLVDRLSPTGPGVAPSPTAASASTPDAAGARSGLEIEGGSRDITSTTPLAFSREVPLINKVAAGYPREFTDLSYPARIADEYIRCPDINDPDAFAARVVGDSMLPEYKQGDIVIFSPQRTLKNGADCFARLEPDHETTFKRIYFETAPGGEELIRLQPLNSAYPPRTLPRDMVAGLYAAVSVIRAVG